MDFLRRIFQHRSGGTHLCLVQVPKIPRRNPTDRPLKGLARQRRMLHDGPSRKRCAVLLVGAQIHIVLFIEAPETLNYTCITGKFAEPLRLQDCS